MVTWKKKAFFEFVIISVSFETNFNVGKKKKKRLKDFIYSNLHFLC